MSNVYLYLRLYIPHARYSQGAARCFLLAAIGAWQMVNAMRNTSAAWENNGMQKDRSGKTDGEELEHIFVLRQTVGPSAKAAQTNTMKRA